MSGCSAPDSPDPTPCGHVWGEPFYGGPVGPVANFTQSLDKIAKLVAARDQVEGIFLGDGNGPRRPETTPSAVLYGLVSALDGTPRLQHNTPAHP